MPPRKRAASVESTATSSSVRSKKSKNGDDASATSKAAPKAKAKAATEAATAAAPAPSKSKRWAAVSGSRNVDEDYKLAMKDPAHAYEYICVCKRFFQGSNGQDEEEEEDNSWEDTDSEGEDEDEADNEGLDDADDEGKKSTKDKDKDIKCDGGKTCICHKLTAERPEHPWVITRAGWRKWYSQTVHAQLRCPDNFEMYTYNDHEAYGILEVVQNLVLDYVEAAANWKEQWVVCEATALFLLGDWSNAMGMADDSQQVNATVDLVYKMFLTMLARLEREGLLAENSEVKDLGTIMAIYIRLAPTFHDIGLCEDDNFESIIGAYATKFGITLRSPSDIKDLLGDLDKSVTLPKPDKAKDDPWGWTKTLSAFKKDHGKIGGDKLDITSWTSAERRNASFNKRDPLGKEEMKALKAGAVMQLA